MISKLVVNNFFTLSPNSLAALDIEEGNMDHGGGDNTETVLITNPLTINSKNPGVEAADNEDSNEMTVISNGVHADNGLQSDVGIILTVCYQ